MSDVNIFGWMKNKIFNKIIATSFFPKRIKYKYLFRANVISKDSVT